MSEHAIYEVFDHQKNELLLHLLATDEQLNQVVVILRTRESVHTLATELSQAGISVDSVHGKKKANLIELACNDLKAGRIRVLVVTDASARNLDLAGVTATIQVDLPEVLSDYTHRIELTEAAGGRLYSFVNKQNQNALGAVESLFGSDLPRLEAEGFSYAARPLQARPTRNKTPKKGPASKPLQHKKKKYKPKKYSR